jgi:hypothetical protein
LLSQGTHAVQLSAFIALVDHFSVCAENPVFIWKDFFPWIFSVLTAIVPAPVSVDLLFTNAILSSFYSLLRQVPAAYAATVHAAAVRLLLQLIFSGFAFKQEDAFWRITEPVILKSLKLISRILTPRDPMAGKEALSMEFCQALPRIQESIPDDVRSFRLHQSFLLVVCALIERQLTPDLTKLVSTCVQMLLDNAGLFMHKPFSDRRITHFLRAIWLFAKRQWSWSQDRFQTILTPCWQLVSNLHWGFGYLAQACALIRLFCTQEFMRSHLGFQFELLDQFMAILEFHRQDIECYYAGRTLEPSLWFEAHGFIMKLFCNTLFPITATGSSVPYHDPISDLARLTVFERLCEFVS